MRLSQDFEVNVDLKRHCGILIPRITLIRPGIWGLCNPERYEHFGSWNVII